MTVQELAHFMLEDEPERYDYEGNDTENWKLWDAFMQEFHDWFLTSGECADFRGYFLSYKNQLGS